jgi:uncharacterized protein (DUF1810 family)
VTVGEDPFDLQRFVAAQSNGVYERALGEVRAGRKQSHWIWFVFPQVAGLGSSAMAQRFAIGSLDEARAYLAHPVLGPRLVACARAVLAIEGRTALEVFGHPDDLKLRSSLTLFERADPSAAVFGEVLDAVYGGERDAATLERL